MKENEDVEDLIVIILNLSMFFIDAKEITIALY